MLKFNAASLYPLLYRREKRGWVEGKWVEKAGQRRRRYYKLTRDGKQVLAAQRSIWESFVAAINRAGGSSLRRRWSRRARFDLIARQLRDAYPESWREKRAESGETRERSVTILPESETRIPPEGHAAVLPSSR